MRSEIHDKIKRFIIKEGFQVTAESESTDAESLICWRKKKNRRPERVKIRIDLMEGMYMPTFVRNDSKEESKEESKLEYRKLCCYEISTESIMDVAERHKLSLKGIDMEDIVYYMKKGVDAAIGDVREQIIKEAIRMSGGKEIDEEEE